MSRVYGHANILPNVVGKGLGGDESEDWSAARREVGGLFAGKLRRVSSIGTSDWKERQEQKISSWVI